MLKLLIFLPPLVVTYYTYTYGRWALEKGNKRGGIGVFILAAFVMVISVYAVFFRPPY
ncbi:hypothetical protein ACOBQJ_05190 [Pelotomaculum propionicicum]|uniref:hypothetical protein n=1 Tax=Pelotomaculum propionicicum TaxID=258475 RepID=UPI003B7E82B6